MTSHRSVRSVLITGRKQHGDRNRGRADYYVEDALFIESPRAFGTGRSQRGPKIFRVRLLCGICTILILIGHGLWREIISLIVRVYSYHPLNQVRQNLPCTFSKKNCCKRIIGCFSSVGEDQFCSCSMGFSRY